jgi:hypothetical protein
LVQVYDDDAYILHCELKMTFTGGCTKHKKVGQHGGKLEQFLHSIVAQGYSVAVVREMVEVTTLIGGKGSSSSSSSTSTAPRKGGGKVRTPIRPVSLH